jgi:arabinan endo-1,5-alpha-L-arabinosidase
MKINRLRLSVCFLLALFIGSYSLAKNRDDINKDASEDKGEVQNYCNPIINYDTPDPTVMKVKGKFYLFATENNRETPVWTSTDLVHWSRKPGSAFASRPTFVAHGGIWAPDAHRIRGKYVLYYAMSVWGGDWKCGIGVAVADAPEGPYKDLGKLFTSEEIGVRNSIDEFFIHDKGHNYLFWGSFHGIYGIELTRDGLHIKKGAAKIKIAGNFMEATYIHKHKGYYYLFGSNGSCCEGDRSTYRIVFGRSKKLFGPYVTKEGRPLLEGNYDVLLHGNSQFVGPGHNAELMTDDAKQDWIIYHSYLRGRSDEGRVAMLDPLNWSEGWPVIENSTPSSSHKVPYFKK